MIQRTVIGTGLIGLALGVTALAQQTTVRVTQPPSSRAQTKAQQKAVFTDACGKCHPIERVTAMRRTKEQWEETINQMVTSRGAALTPEQIDTALKYLVAEYGPSSPPPTATPPGARAGTPSTRTGTVLTAPPPRTRAASGAGADNKMIVD